MGDHPCKITDFNKLKNGKHGAGKVVVEAKDILTGKTYEGTFKAQTQVDAPIVKKIKYQLLNIDGSNLDLLTESMQQKNDINMPEDQELAKKIEATFANA